MKEKINKTYLYRISMIGALGSFLFRFDTAIVSGTITYINRQFSLSPTMTGWYVSSALVGCLLGVISAGYFSDRYGPKKILLFCVLLFIVSAIGCIFSFSFSNLIMYRVAGGIAIGIASMLSSIYISEISPAPNAIRGRAMAMGTLSVWIGNAIIGQMVPVMLSSLTPAGTFLTFAILTLPAIPLIVFYVPETKGKTLEEIELYWLKK